MEEKLYAHFINSYYIFPTFIGMQFIILFSQCFSLSYKIINFSSIKRIIFFILYFLNYSIEFLFISFHPSINFPLLFIHLFISNEKRFTYLYEWKKINVERVLFYEIEKLLQLWSVIYVLPIVNLLIILRYSLLYLQLYLKANVLFSVINCVIVELVKWEAP